jgi:hypothetical protein
LNILGNPYFSSFSHDNGVVFQTSDGLLAYAVISASGATFKELIIQDRISIPDAGLTFSKIAGLSDALLAKASQASLNVLTSNISALETNLNNGYSTLSSSLALKASQADLDFTAASKQDIINAGTSLRCGEIEAGATKISVDNQNGEHSAEIGSQFSVLKFFNGDSIDSYWRGSGDGKTLTINGFAERGVRIGTSSCKLSVNCAPNLYQLEVVGSGKISGSWSCNNLVQTSDQRIKTDVEFADPDECLRLVTTVKPRTYKRTDMAGTPARCGYIAQDWDRELSGGFRCIMGASEDENGPLLGLDYSRLTVVLHGALLSALARIEALESRLQ